MTSIRRGTSGRVAACSLCMLLLGGLVLMAIIRAALTDQFDDALRARAGAIQSLTVFDGTTVELDLVRDAAHESGSMDDSFLFVEWVFGDGAWHVLGKSDKLETSVWPADSLRDAALGTHKASLPDGESGRIVLMEFTPFQEPVDEADVVHSADSLARFSRTLQSAASPRARLLVAVPSKPLDDIIARVAWSIIGVGAALCIASLALVRWAVGRGLAPLNDLSRRVRTIGPDSLNSRFDTSNMPEELRPVGEQLSALLARLDAAFAREKRFAAAASHELRTPIAELRMLLEVATNQPRTSEEWQRTAATSLGVLARTQSLCETLLRLSRDGASSPLPSNDTRTEVTRVLFDQVARAVALNNVDARCVHLDAANGLLARIDEHALASIVSNLLDNSIRHGVATPTDPVIVCAMRQENCVRVDITNTAKNLTSEDVKHIFEPFWRKDTSRQDQSSFGLGLAVARALARANNADIAASLESPSRLTVKFTIDAIVLECSLST